ncbi:TipAS antibiotic-recognition domain-containing protein, partial [Escherichia coli]|uniref:TipAS antibiotic-recognition domain-containing protein n=1 Tax=Escherichia coli TaxID=562 RepID=UPI0028DD53C8
VEESLDKDPASPEAQALGQRWSALVDEFTGGDRQITQGLNALYKDRENWPGSFKQQMQPFGNSRVYEYMDRVLAVRK